MGCDVALAADGGDRRHGCTGGVEILHRGDHDPHRRAQPQREYEERLLNRYVPAERGLVDAVIDPADTRREIAATLATLATKRDRSVGSSHDNTPL